MCGWDGSRFPAVVSVTALRDDLEGLVAREGVTVFLNTHNLPEAERLCQQVGVIRSGKLLTVGSPDALRQRIGRPQAEVFGDGFTRKPGIAWVNLADIGPITPPNPLPSADTQVQHQTFASGNDFIAAVGSAANPAKRSGCRLIKSAMMRTLSGEATMYLATSSHEISK